MRTRSKFTTAGLAAAPLLFGGVASAVPVPSPRPQAAVILGDSYAAGEGGRWKGNSEAPIGSGNRSGTDLAAYPVGSGWGYAPAGLAYEAQSYTIGSNRSLYAPITYLRYQNSQHPTLFSNVFNLADSGARTAHLLPYEAGGQNYHGHAPQIELLKQVADTHDIKLIVIGVGGNDLKFREAITACLDAWAKENFSSLLRSCMDDIRDNNLALLGDVWFRVGRVIDETKELMAEKGQWNYKLLLMGVPSVLPGVAAEWKYGFSNRGEQRGCPIKTDDARYIENVLVPKINATLRAVAQGKGVDFLSTQRAFEGHRLCETGTLRATTSSGVGERDAEWMRRFDQTLSNVGDVLDLINLYIYDGIGAPDSQPQPNFAGDQGSIQESFHPNHYGQKAIGHCIRRYVLDTAPSPKALECSNGPSGLASDMMVAPMTPLTVLSYTADHGTGDNGPWWVVSKFVQFTGGGTRKVMRVNLDFDHPRKGHLDIEVIDPSGRVYVYRRPNPNDTGAWPSPGRSFMFYHQGPWQYLPYQDGDFQPGTYTLRYRDAISGYSGTFRNWTIHFF